MSFINGGAGSDNWGLNNFLEALEDDLDSITEKGLTNSGPYNLTVNWEEKRISVEDRKRYESLFERIDINKEGFISSKSTILLPF
jgi:hypothetical protein